MSETIVRTRSVLCISLNLHEDGNVEVTSTTWDKKNALGRQNFLLTRNERCALLSFLAEELEKFAVEQHGSSSEEMVGQLAEARRPRSHLELANTGTILPSVPVQNEAWR